MTSGPAQPPSSAALAPGVAKAAREAAAFEADLRSLRERVELAVEAFRGGGAILVGDDGRRENEADLVFHASHATAENVNAALVHARGLLCVSVGHDLADTLGFFSAPRMPGDFAHTGFTLSVDAKDDVGSGISARDRGVTIRLMAQPGAQATQFLSPGHVFPVRAHAGGLLARTGHTEALQELCALAGLAPAAAMCEVLGDDGDALRPADLVAPSPSSGARETEQTRYLKALPYLSTVDLLWHRVFSGRASDAAWKPAPGVDVALGQGSTGPFGARSGAWDVLRLHRGLEERITCEALLLVAPGSDIVPERVRVVLSNGVGFVDNGVPAAEACAEVRVFHTGPVEEPLEGSVADFCDLSAKVGLGGTKPAVKRVVTLLRAITRLSSLAHGSVSFPSESASREAALALASRMRFPVEGDAAFLRAVLA